MEKSNNESIIEEYPDYSDDYNDDEETSQQRLTAVEQEFLHDISFDYYGHRMVTCGADQKIKIWQKMELSKYDEEGTPKASGSPRVNNRLKKEFDNLASPIVHRNIKSSGVTQGM